MSAIDEDDDVEELLISAQTGDEAWVCQLILSVDVTTYHDGGRTALTWASERGREAIVTRLLESGAPVDQTDAQGWTTLMWAVDENQVKIVKMLLDNGAQVDKADRDGSTALMWAGLCGNRSTATVLLEHNAEINNVNNEQWRLVAVDVRSEERTND
eukprot:TRINITY_DN1624_c0_g1_i1.p1 TRINITY_DN1624_c0_g1~~TRINITY_DN1624_c0_g1_i1.p1  ORF type:complete len:157 (-),score=22.73 TRINITY_DN1624_c0_g1_i1:686-1156(-)